MRPARLRGMGRRARRRGAEQTTTIEQATGPGHQARVRVDDEVWRDFKLAARGSISRALGTLVEEEVDRYRARELAAGRVSDREMLDALARAEELEARASEIVGRLERLRAVRPPGRE